MRENRELTGKGVTNKNSNLIQMQLNFCFSGAQIDSMGQGGHSRDFSRNQQEETEPEFDGKLHRRLRRDRRIFGGEPFPDLQQFAAHQRGARFRSHFRPDRHRVSRNRPGGN